MSMSELNPTRDPVPHRSQKVPTKRPRILLAEDDESMRELLAAQLRRNGYEVVECSDGQILVERLASLFLPRVRKEDYDLVISDVRMPGFTGLEVLDGLHTYDVPPMILITAFGDESVRARASRLGAVAVFDKPFHIPDLLAKVHDVVTLQQMGPPRKPPSS